MTALVAEKPGMLSVQQRGVPVPGDGEAVVAVAYAGICHTDRYVLDGGHPAVTYPVVPGHEFGGTIAAIHGRPRGLAEGDRVAVQTQLSCGACPACQRGEPGYCPGGRQLGSTHDGGWQSFIALPRQQLFRLPDALSLRDAALVEPAANGHAAVRNAAITEGETVAVIGPGAIGLMALQFARLRQPGLLVLIGTPRSARRLEAGKALGAGHVISDSDHAAAELLELTAGRGADVVIQCAGSVAAFRLAVDLALPPRARIVIEGYAGSALGVPVQPDRLAVSETTIRGVNGWSIPDFQAAIDLAAAGSISLAPLLTDVFSPADHQKAIAGALEHPGGTIKAAFDFSGGDSTERS